MQTLERLIDVKYIPRRLWSSIYYYPSLSVNVYIHNQFISIGIICEGNSNKTINNEIRDVVEASLNRFSNAYLSFVIHSHCRCTYIQ